MLGGVFLCVTGAEALYADMGHFGARPIRLAWLTVVFPSLVLNYVGQAAIVVEEGVTADSPFYRLCPVPLLVPMIALATVATVIASQSIITGAYSMAIQLSWFPRLKITQTSAESYGQIYLGTSKNSLHRSRTTKLPSNDSALFSFRFVDVHSRRVRDWH
jgi:KUP system potassium uptake protein